MKLSHGNFACSTEIEYCTGLGYPARGSARSGSLEAPCAERKEVQRYKEYNWTPPNRSKQSCDVAPLCNLWPIVGNIKSPKHAESGDIFGPIKC